MLELWYIINVFFLSRHHWSDTKIFMNSSMIHIKTSHNGDIFFHVEMLLFLKGI